MKTGRSFLLILLVVTSTAFAQKKDLEAVEKAVRQLNQAMIDGNHIALDQLSADKLSYGHSSGLIEDKNTFITALVDGTSGFTSIDLTEQTVSISGDVAIVRHKLSAGTDNKGQQPGSVKLSVMQIWQKQKGNWLLLARQATKLP